MAHRKTLFQHGLKRNDSILLECCRRYLMTLSRLQTKPEIYWEHYRTWAFSKKSGMRCKFLIPNQCSISIHPEKSLTIFAENLHRKWFIYIHIYIYIYILYIYIYIHIYIYIYIYIYIIYYMYIYIYIYILYI